MSYPHILISDSQSALFSTIAMTEINLIFGLASRKSTFYTLFQGDIDSYWSEFDDSSSGILSVDALC